GKVLVGGAFSHFRGTALNNLVRLNSDGTLDTNFNATLGTGPNGSIRALVMQLDNKILIGGSFTNFNGTVANRIVRLNADGSLDTNFLAAIGSGASATVEAIALQPDNRILLSGQFTSVNGVTRNSIARLLPTGDTDPTIN